MTEKDKTIVAKDARKFDMFHPLRIFVNQFNLNVAKDNLKIYPQVAIFAFDQIGLSINLEGRYENRSLCLIKSFLESVIPDPHRSSALDIGANIGNHSIFFSEFFGEIYAFEPNPRTFALLKFNSEYASSKKNINCFNFGLSNQNGHLLFRSSKANIGGSSIVSDTDQGSDAETFLIDVKRADEITELCDKEISLIKIDVEGHELPALRGAEEIIKRNHPVLLFEQRASDFRNGTSEVVNFLGVLNYKFLTIEKSFYFGESFIFRFISLILRYIFGSQYMIVERDYFHKRFYDIIIAVPKR